MQYWEPEGGIPDKNEFCMIDSSDDEEEEDGEVPMLDKDFDEGEDVELPAEDKFTNDLDPQPKD